MSRSSKSALGARLKVRSKLSRLPLLRAARSVGLEALETRRLFSVLTVNTTSDSDSADGVLSLREAIEIVNGSLPVSSLDPGEHAQVDVTQPLGTNDTIKFNIPGAGVQTIGISSSAPTITKPVTIDGYTQTGAAPATATAPAKILIALQGGPASGDCFDVAAAHVTIRGLSIGFFEGDGINLQAASGSDVIAGNYIGVQADGVTDGPNGVGINVASAGNTIGGTTPADRNVISGNIYQGIKLQAPTAAGLAGTVIEGNYIGTNAAGTAAIVVGGDGIDISGNGVTVGGTTAGARNIISGNKIAGIALDGGNDGGDLSNTVIQANYIGTDVTGAAALGNGLGITIYDDEVGPNILIGGTAAGAGNVISGNTSQGISADLSSSVIQGNVIGLNATLTAALGNGTSGISGSRNVLQIGGTAAGAGNVISGNLGDGISLVIGGATIQGNYIGTNASGANFGNLKSGVYDNFSSATIGGTIPQAANVIAFNHSAGIAVVDFGEGEIRLNSIYSNTGLGIDLSRTSDADGVSFNDTGDADDGSNSSQNFPVLGSAVSSNGSTTIQGAINTNGNALVVIDFFADTPNLPAAAQGRLYLGSQVVTTNSSGNATFSATFAASVAPGQFITATATQSPSTNDGMTSEFSQPIAVQTPVAPPPPPPPATVAPSVSIGDVKQNEGNNGTTPFTFTLTRSGDLSAASIVTVSTADGTATAASDFTAKDGTTVSFAANQATATVTINVNGDTTVEGDETFYVNIAAVTNANIADGQGLGTIVNDDVAPPPPPAMTGSLSGFTFNDSNANGKLDSGESMAGGKTVFLDANNNGKLDAGEISMVSDNNGNYSFGKLAAGTYHVRRVFPAGYTYSTPLIDVTLSAGQMVNNLAIGSKTSSSATPPPAQPPVSPPVQPPVPPAQPPKTGTASLSGFTFNDTNKDGHYESGEVKTAGKTVFLDANNNGKLDDGEKSVVTGANGEFSFGGLAAGQYHVRRVFPSGYTYSTVLIDVLLADGQTAKGLQIGSKFQ